MKSARNNGRSTPGAANLVALAANHGPAFRVAAEAIISKLITDFIRVFGAKPEAIASAPGRVVGNLRGQ